MKTVSSVIERVYSGFHDITYNRDFFKNLSLNDNLYVDLALESLCVSVSLQF